MNAVWETITNEIEDIKDETKKIVEKHMPIILFFVAMLNLALFLYLPMPQSLTNTKFGVNIDKFFIILTIIGTLLLKIGIIYNLTLINEIIHVIYGSVMIGIPVLSKNPYMITYHIGLCLLTLFLRYIYSACPLLFFEEKDGEKYFGINEINLNWDTTTMCLIVVDIAKLILR